jgi:hypothetical protein
MGIKANHLGACIPIPKLDHTQRVPRYDCAVTENANRPNKGALFANLVDRHAFYYPTGFEIVFADAAVSISSHNE